MAKQGDGPALARLVGEGHDVRKTDKNGSTPLHHASSGGSIECTAMLLEAAAEVNAKDVLKWTALHHACMNGHVACATLLIEANADVNVQADASSNATPLLFACSRGHAAIAGLLVDAGANLAIPTSDLVPVTARQKAQQLGHMDVVKILDATTTTGAERRSKWEAAQVANAAARKGVVAEASMATATKSEAPNARRPNSVLGAVRRMSTSFSKAKKTPVREEENLLTWRNGDPAQDGQGSTAMQAESSASGDASNGSWFGSWWQGSATGPSTSATRLRLSAMGSSVRRLLVADGRRRDSRAAAKGSPSTQLYTSESQPNLSA